MASGSEVTRVLKELIGQSFGGKAWHGPNLRGSLRGLTPQVAAWRPGPGRHSIWELALHCAYWEYVVLRKLAGGKRGAFARSPSNFPALPPELTPAAWKADLALLDQTHRGLLTAVDEKLAEPHGDEAAHRKTLWLIEGIACHNVYHAGQIRLLIRLSGAKRPA
jgi:uncharacterized damage-inducible protein DinB